MWTPTIALLPGALTIYLGFDGGGYFPPATGVACRRAHDRARPATDAGTATARGVGLAAGLVAAAIALFGVWSLVSSSWSDSPARAVVEFDRALLYLLMFALVATLPRTPQTARTVLMGIAAGAAFVCIGGLLTRVAARTCSRSRRTCSTSGCPTRSPTGTRSACWRRWRSCSPPISRARAGAPAARVARRRGRCRCSPRRSSSPSRAASIVVMVVGVIGYVRARAAARLRAGADRRACRRPRSPSSCPTTPTLLAPPNPTTAGGGRPGPRGLRRARRCARSRAGVARYVLSGSASTSGSRRSTCQATRNRRRRGRPARCCWWPATAWVALDVNDRISRQYDKFMEGDVIRQTEDARERLTDRRQQRAHRSMGGGHRRVRATTPEGHRRGHLRAHVGAEPATTSRSRDGHSLYLETLSELGMVGGILLVLRSADPRRRWPGMRAGTQRALWARAVRRRRRVGAPCSAGLGLGAARR